MAARSQMSHTRRMCGTGSAAPLEPVRAARDRGAGRAPFPTGQIAFQTAFLAAILAALALVLATGCGGPRAYQPDTTLVSKLGHDEAVARLRTLLGRAESPTVVDVDVTHEHIDLVWLDTRTVSRWRYRAIESIDIRSSDHVVTLRLENKRYVYRFDFTTAADARQFVDLVASFYRASASAEVALPPITRDRERP